MAAMSPSCILKPNSSMQISDLPLEMFDYIINLLPLCDRKSVSLVSRFWCQRAFSYTGMAHVKLRINGFMTEKRDLSVLRKSVRPYRHLILYFGHRSCCGLDLATVMDILASLGSSIEGFVLMNDCNPKQLKEFISRMPNLKQITVNVVDKKDQSFDADNFPIMKRLTEFRMKNNMLEEPWMDIFQTTPNIVKLSLKMVGSSGKFAQKMEVIKQFATHLKYLELYTSKIPVPFERLNLRQLQSLKLWNINCDRDEYLLCQFFKNLPLLRTASLRFAVTSDVLKVLCANCPRLSTLRFKTDGLNGKMFCFFEQLQCLKVLIVDGYIRPDILKDCKPLVSVDFLSISKNPIKSGTSMAQLSEVLPKLRTLQVNRSYGMQIDNTFVQEICRNFDQLKCLIMDTAHVCTLGTVEQVSPQIFSQLVEMTNLEELTLSCMRIATTNPQHDCLFIHFLRACLGDGCRKRFQSGLRRLKLKNCHWVMGGNLVNAVQLFPNLQYFEVNRCRMITDDDMNFARKTMPECVIHFVRWERHCGTTAFSPTKLALG